MKAINKNIFKLAVSPNRRSGFLSGSFLISPIKKLIRKKSAKIVSIITLFALVSGIYFTSQAQGVDFTFTQTDWSGGESAITATHTDNQTGWSQYSGKDSDVSTGAELQLSSAAKTANIDFNTEGNYIQEDAATGTDFTGGAVQLYGLSASNPATYDPDKKNPYISLSPDNLTAQNNTVNGWHSVATNATLSGADIYYWERVATIGTQFRIGAYKADQTVDFAAGNSAGTTGWDFYYHYAFQVGYVNMYEYISTSTTQGSTIGVAFQPSSGKIWSHKNGVWLGGKSPATSPDDPYYTVESGLSWIPFDDIYWMGNQLTARNSLDACQYEPAGVVGLPASLGITYPTSQPYHITTSDTSQIDTTVFSHLADVSLTQTTPADTSLKYLVSFDSRTTWKHWDGFAWQATSLDNLQTDGMDKTALEDLNQSEWESAGGFTPGVTTTLDFAVDLQTSASSDTPTLDNIAVNYTVPQILTSSVYDTTVSGANLSKLQWSETLPANTDILFQLRTSGDGTTWGPWCGPDAGAGCDSDAYFTDPTGESETIDDTQKDHLDDRYFQYQATLISTDGTSTPTLSDVTVSYATVNLPTVTTQTISEINSVTATGNADLTATGGENPTRYIQWGTVSGTYPDQCSADLGSTGLYSCQLTALTPDTTYYYRAKAVNSAGEAYGAELSFTTLPAEVTISNPTSSDITELLTDSYIVLDSGTLDATDQVTTHIDVTLATGANQITLPDNTAITNTEGGNFDMSAFDISLRDVRSEVSDSLAAVKVGVPNTKLTFTNNPVTLSIYLGSQHNGKTMAVQYQEDGELTWNDHTTCVITDSLCSFTTTHATIYTVNGDGSISGETTVSGNLDIEATIALACTDTLTLNPITGTGQSAIDAANEATCNVKTNNSNGYKLEWSAPQENLTNATADTISGYLPITPNTPEIWTIDQATAAWGARLKSTSTDPDTDLWGTSDGYAGKWLNVSTAAYQIIVRSTETLQTGSDQIIQFGSEIGSNKFQPTGTYTGSVVMTATTL